MVAHYTQHVLCIFLILRERSEEACQISTGGVGLTRHDGRNRPADCISTRIIVWNSHVHQHGANVAESQTECAIVVGFP